MFDRFFKDRKKDKGKKYDNLPLHIAVIPDGNGRWAKKRKLPRTAGHRAGSNTLKTVVKYLSGIGVRFFTIYAFSTENWTRPKEEVASLMNLLLEYLRNAERELEGSNIRIRVIGNRERLSTELQNEILRVEKMTFANTGLNLVFAINYGGRDEIAEAAAKMARDVKRGKLRLNDIDEKVFESYLYTNDIPDPDLVIRTSGEIRSSNFLLWQTAYSEFAFPEVLWPDFTVKYMEQALEEYKSRVRRFGGI